VSVAVTDEQRDEQLARDALSEITPEASIGDITGREVAEDGVVTLTFAATMLGYPGWHWTVSLAEVDGLEPTVLEVELLPGDGALLAPEWVPWSVRLEEYRAAQAAAGEHDETAERDGDDAEHDDEDADDDDLDEDHEDDDDLGDDPDDGIDFESEDSAVAAPVEVHGDEQDEAESESDEDRPEPPAVAGGEDAREEEEQHAEGDHPEH
jgi:hypothetical protein